MHGEVGVYTCACVSIKEAGIGFNLSGSGYLVGALKQ